MPSPSRPRCLLVEDVEAMRALLRALLEGSGFKVSAAGSLGEARRMLKPWAGSPFDAVVLDLQLPDGDGLELLPEIDQSTNVIALTADESRETYLQCISAGCAQVLNKSEELSKLRNVLAENVVAETDKRRETPGSVYPYMRYLAEVRLELQEARQRTDLLGLRRIAHRLRGTAIHFGHPGIGRAAKSVSVALAAGNIDQVDAESSALGERIAQALEIFYLREQNSEHGPASRSVP